MDAPIHVRCRRTDGCNKTRLLRPACSLVDSPPESITWYYGEWKSEEGLPSTSLFDVGTRNLVVIDDPMTETDGRLKTLFTKKIHHSSTSVLYLAKNMLPKNKDIWWCSRIRATCRGKRIWPDMCVRVA